jgi:hypothetical protein
MGGDDAGFGDGDLRAPRAFVHGGNAVGVGGNGENVGVTGHKRRNYEGAPGGTVATIKNIAGAVQI